MLIGIGRVLAKRQHLTAAVVEHDDVLRRLPASVVRVNHRADALANDLDALRDQALAPSVSLLSEVEKDSEDAASRTTSGNLKGG